MIKSILTFSLIFAVFRANSTEIADFERFTAILAQLESGGNSKAIGDNGKAIGIYQIHYSYWKDATDYDKSIGGQYKDCFNPVYAKKVVNSYLSRYCKSNNWEDMARCHNSGPGWRNKKQLTNNYWSNFQKTKKIISHSNRFQE